MYTHKRIMPINTVANAYTCSKGKLMYSYNIVRAHTHTRITTINILLQTYTHKNNCYGCQNILLQIYTDTYICMCENLFMTPKTWYKYKFRHMHLKFVHTKPYRIVHLLLSTEKCIV